MTAVPKATPTTRLRDLQPPDPYYGVVRGHVHISEIAGVDGSYQRSIEHGHVRKLDQFWNQALCDDVLLAQREDGSLWIVKGQHRVERMRVAGAEWVPCRVIKSDGPEFEADVFYVDATGVRLLKRMDKYRANTTRRDADTVAMNETLALHGFRIADYNSNGTLAAVGQVERVWQMGGEPLLAEVLAIIGGVWATYDKAREGEIIAGLGIFLNAVRADPNYQRVRLMQVLAHDANTPSQIVGRAIENAVGRGRGVQGNGRSVLFAIELRDTYNKHYARKKLAPLVAPNGARYPGQR